MPFMLHRILRSLFYSLALFAVIISFAACSGSNENIGGVKVIPIGETLEGTHKFAKMSDYFADIDYIPFQTDSICMLGNVYKFGFPGDNIVIADAVSRRCMLFGKDGSFRGFVGDLGNANGEYSIFMDLSVNPFNGEIGVYDFRKVVVYDRNGNFVRNVVCGDMASERGFFLASVELFDKYYVMNGCDYYNDDAYSIFIDENVNIVHIDGQIAEPDNLSNERPPVRLGGRDAAKAYIFDNELYILSKRADTIFSYNNSLQKTPRYILDYGKFVGEKRVAINGVRTYESDNILLFGLFTFSNRFAFMHEYKLTMCYMVYNKRSGKTEIIPYDVSARKYGFENDIDGSGMSFLPMAVEGNAMYQVVDSYYFIECAERSNSAKMKAVAATLTDESNPVLVKAILK